MKVSVKLFVTLRPYHPGPNRSVPLEVELPEGAVAGDLVGILNLPRELVKHAFINNEQKTLETQLKAGDKINLFPPVVGG
jgi:molybdopterin converting factor small subunit